MKVYTRVCFDSRICCENRQGFRSRSVVALSCIALCKEFLQLDEKYNFRTGNSNNFFITRVCLYGRPFAVGSVYVRKDYATSYACAFALGYF